MLVKGHFLNCRIQNNLSARSCHIHRFTGQAVEHKSTAELNFFLWREREMNVFIVCRITQYPIESITLHALERGANCFVAKRGSNRVHCTHTVII